MTANEALANYLESLPTRERALKKRDIRIHCRKSTDVLYDWLHGRSKIDIAWQAKITEALGINVFQNVTD